MYVIVQQFHEFRAMSMWRSKSVAKKMKVSGVTPPTNSQPQELLLDQNSLSCLLTDEGASGRPPNGLVEEGRGESKACALCSGNAGVADLDISHAFAKEIRDKSPMWMKEKPLYVS